MSFILNAAYFSSFSNGFTIIIAISGGFINIVNIWFYNYHLKKMVLILGTFGMGILSILLFMSKLYNLNHLFMTIALAFLYSFRITTFSIYIQLRSHKLLTKNEKRFGYLGHLLLFIRIFIKHLPFPSIFIIELTLYILIIIPILAYILNSVKIIKLIDSNPVANGNQIRQRRLTIFIVIMGPITIISTTLFSALPALSEYDFMAFVIIAMTGLLLNVADFYTEYYRNKQEEMVVWDTLIETKRESVILRKMSFPKRRSTEKTAIQIPIHLSLEEIKDEPIHKTSHNRSRRPSLMNSSSF
eukprot:NODE_375_length_8520_cov_0.377390.p2 type:complete len:300 gc:universal NODE_375_length_8520_cov_0.377390:7459-8358(+)